MCSVPLNITFQNQKAHFDFSAISIINLFVCKNRKLKIIVAQNQVYFSLTQNKLIRKKSRAGIGDSWSPGTQALCISLLYHLSVLTPSSMSFRAADAAGVPAIMDLFQATRWGMWKKTEIHFPVGRSPLRASSQPFTQHIHLSSIIQNTLIVTPSYKRRFLKNGFFQPCTLPPLIKLRSAIKEEEKIETKWPSPAIILKDE